MRAPIRAVNTSTRPRPSGSAVRLASLDLVAGEALFAVEAVTTAASTGFQAPAIVSTSLDGEAVALSDLRGQIVVVEFWSIHCPFSERIRPEIPLLADRLPSDVAWIAMPRESASDEVSAHLATHPMAAVQWQHEAQAWRRYNPKTITPTFYVLDRDGRIVAIEHGAAAVPVLEATIRDLTEDTPGRRSPAVPTR